MTQNKTIVGLTGGIGCGKSTLAGILRAGGFFVVDADRISQTLMRPGSRLEGLVVDRFGESILGPDGHVQRRKLGRIVFSDPASRKWVMDLMEPFFEDAFQCIIAHGPDLIVFDAPLFFEMDMHLRWPDPIVVWVDQKTQFERIKKRDPDLSDDDIHARIDVQIPLNVKVEMAGLVVDNSHDGILTDSQIIRVEEFLTRDGLRSRV